jgi:hypothetical protein
LNSLETQNFGQSVLTLQEALITCKKGAESEPFRLVFPNALKNRGPKGVGISGASNDL